MIFRANNKQISIYDYYVTNACVLRFIDANDEDIKNFFYNLGEITSFEILDDDGITVKDSRPMNLEFTYYMVEKSYVNLMSESENEVDEQSSKNLVEMTSVFLEVPTIEKTVSNIKSSVKNIQSAIPNTTQLRSLFNIQVESFTDEQALLVSDFYEAWDEIPDGTELKEGKRLRYLVDGLLYKVKTGQTHKKQSDWNPKDAASLFEVIEPSHSGTLEDPIPAHVNMEYVKGKYYIEDGVTYLCNSDIAKDGVVLQYVPSQLIGIYFEKIEN